MIKGLAIKTQSFILIKPNLKEIEENIRKHVVKCIYFNVVRQIRVNMIY